MALLICGWILVEKPPARIPPATAAEQSRPAASANPATDAGDEVTWPEKLRDDAAACSNDALGLYVRNDACTRVIQSGLLNDRQQAKAFNLRGFNYASADQLDRALVDFDAALTNQPGDPESLAYRGWVYTRQKRYDAALRDFNQAIEHSTPAEVAQIRIYRARIFFDTFDYGKAMADLDAAVKLDPNNANIYLARGDVEYAQQHQDDALRDYNEFSRRAPGDPEGQIGRGKVLEATGHLQDAMSAYERALKLDPSHAGALAARNRLRSSGAAK